MRMKKLLTIIGARPQWMKAAALSRTLRSGSHGMVEQVLHTGQHVSDDMSGIFFRELGLRQADIQLEVGSDPIVRMGQMMEGISSAIAAYQPDAIVLYGDTDSTLAGAWSGSRAGIPIVHIEAGLRSFDRSMPEEVNRVLTDHLSSVLFCPTHGAVDQLRKEGVFTGSRPDILVSQCGDLMLDTARFIGGPPTSIPAESKQVLWTMHRPSNVDDVERLKGWVFKVGEVANQWGLNVIFPVHPRTAKSLLSAFGKEWKKQLVDLGIQVEEPAGYVQMTKWLHQVGSVWTDSGGLQKEAFFFHRPSIVMRDTTEWSELVSGGFAQLCPQPDDLLNCMLQMPELPLPYDEPFYGSGQAAMSIADSLQAWFQK